MAGSSRSRSDRVAPPIRRRTERLSSGTAMLLIAAFSLLCWALLIFLAKELWSVLA
jgi:hypothetical protein